VKKPGKRASAAPKASAGKKTVAKRPTPKASTRTAKPAPRKAKAAAPKTKTPKPRALAVRSAPPRPAGSARRQKVADAKPASAVADQPQSRLLEDGPPTAESRGAGCYVYCIIRTVSPLQFGHIGIGAEPSLVRTIGYKDLAAVISDTPLDIHDPTRENVLAHERVNETVMREHTVLPMSFGTVFRTPQDIVELLRSAHTAFNDVLIKMENKVEFGLKILWEPESVIRGIEGQDENLRRLKQEISSQRGSTYFARMQYGRLVDSLLQERSAELVADVFDQLRGVAIASRTNKPIGDKMILNAAFLVAREREAEFDSRVKELGARHEHVNIRYTGPWPPYNFVNIRLKLERASES